MSGVKSAAVIGAALMVAASGANAAPFEFAGLYIGAHAGYTEMESEVDSSSNTDGGAIGGFQAGYNFVDGNLMYGLETDISLTSANPDGRCFAFLKGDGSCDFSVGPLSSLRARAGYASGDLLVYGTGGVAAGHYKLDVDANFGPPIDILRTFGKFGWTAGAGLEYMLGDMISVKLEYRYTQFFEADFNSNIGGEHEVDLNYHTIMTGVNWHF